MRVLFTCVGGYGHFHPLVPLARALVDAGHDVAFATDRAFGVHVRQAGFEAIPAGVSADVALAEFYERFPDAANSAADAQGGSRFGRMFTEIIAPAMLTDLVAICRGRKPDLLIHEEGEYAGPIAATLSEIPSVNHGWGSPLRLPGPRAEALAPLWRTWGLEPEPLAGLFRYLYLDRCPPSLQSADIHGISVAHTMRPIPFDTSRDERLPAWIDTLPARPTVYAGMGTTSGWGNAPHVFSAILDALRREPVNLIMTVGPHTDPASFGPAPDNAHIEQYVPLSLIFPRCDVILAHGGAGTTLSALISGIPLLMLPRGAPSQLTNADVCVRAGVARRLLEEEITPGAIRQEVRTLLYDPRYRERARQLRGEIAGMPGLEERVGLLERLARDKTPITRR